MKKEKEMKKRKKESIKYLQVIKFCPERSLIFLGKQFNDLWCLECLTDGCLNSLVCVLMSLVKLVKWNGDDVKVRRKDEGKTFV